MQLVIADTSPINYLILINQIELLPQLFEKIALPAAVQAELADVDAPASVRLWIANPPDWLEIRATPDVKAFESLGLDEGETAAIALAKLLKADLLLIDERRGFRAAMRVGLSATGTLGILDIAAERRLINFSDVIHALMATNFRVPVPLLDMLVAKHTPRSGA